MVKKKSLLLLVVTALLGCARLPANFEDLPLEQKVEAYSTFFSRGGTSSIRARQGISLHGYPAADAMVPYVTGENEAIPLSEAVKIVVAVQMRGCSLRGTKVEDALESAARRAESANDVELVNWTLEVIHEGGHRPYTWDGAGPGACLPYLRPDHPDEGVGGK